MPDPAGPTAYPSLLAPGRIGSLELRNRILMAPMGDALGHDDGTVSPAQIAYYAARARGGAGLILVGSVSVSYPRGCFDATQTAASNDSFLPGLSELTAAVHAHGGAIAAQLTHNGAMSLLDIANGEPMLVPAVPPPPHPDRLSLMLTPGELAAVMSPFSQPTSRVQHHVADEADLAWVVERFADAAERCRRAGFDGIELHAGHGYLLDEFLTPSLNDRADGWGGTPRDRARLLCDVLRAVRARVGSDYPVWIRVNALEHHKPNGERFEEQLEVIELAVAEGIDAVHVSAYASVDVATGPTDSYAPHVVGGLADYAAAVRALVAVPVITVGRFEPEEAEQVLADGRADFVAMGRKLLADPDLPAKLASGRRLEIRPCIYQYRCIGNIFVKDVVHCVANPATGREQEIGAGRSATPRRVLVVGAGAGGLEAARTLAAEGHHVALWEASERLGGTLALAGRADPVLDQYLTWLLHEVERSGTELHLGRAADLTAVQAAAPDLVVLATGAAWDRPAVPGAEHALTVPQLGAWLDGDERAVGPRVAVVGGGKVGISLAQHARAGGRSVVVADPGSVLVPELGLPGRFRLVADATAAGIDLRTDTEVVAIAPDSITLRAAGEETELPVDTVVVSSGRRAVAPLAAELEAAGLDVRLVGDCHAAAGIEGANLDAARLAVALR